MTPAAVLLACAVAVADWGPVRLDAEGVPLPPGVAARLGSSRFRSPGDLIDLRFTPDGRQLVGTTARAVCVWDAHTGRRVAIHTGFRRIMRLGIRPDGGIVLIVGGVGGLQCVVLDRESGRILHRRPLNDDHDDLALSADGTRIALRSGGLMQVLDADTGKMVGDLRFSISDISPNHFAFSPDGKHLVAVFSQNWTEVREVATGNMPYSGTAGDAESDVQEVEFSTDGRELLRLVHSEKKPYRLEAIDLKTEQARTLLTFDQPGKRRGGIVPSHDGKSLYLAAQDEVTHFDFATKKQLERRTIPFPTIVNRGVLSPDGAVLAVATSTSGVDLFDAKTLTKLPQSSDGIVTRSERGKFVADGKRLAVLRGESFQVLDVGSGVVVGQAGESGEGRYDVHPDGTRYVRSSLKSVEVRDLATHSIQHSFPWESEEPIVPVFLPNGRQLCGNNFHEFKLWNLKSGVQEAHHSVPGGAMMPRPDGRSALKFRVLEGDTEAVELEIVDLATGESLPDWPLQRFENGAGAADEHFTKLLIQIRRNHHGLFDLTEGRLVWQRTRFSFGLESSAFSPDGRTIALRGRRATQFLEAATGKLRYTIPSIESQRPLAFTPDGKHLAAIGSTAPVYLWDVRGALRNFPTKLDRPTTESLWSDLLGDDASISFLALQRLAAAPESTVPFVREKVPPAAVPDAEAVKRWIEALGAPAFRDREAAMKELKKSAASIVAELRAARDATPSPEVHERLAKILATTYPETPESVRRTRIVELVEWCGTPDAKRLLADWSAGAKGSLLAAEAKAARERLR